MRKKLLLFTIAFLIIKTGFSMQQDNRFILNELEYFENRGVNAMVFQDIYPDGHQSGVSIIMHGTRIATNGDIRLEPTPGQWSPMPVQKNRVVDHENNRITATLSFPDSSKMMRGFNPIYYPDLYFNYDVNVTTIGNSIKITVDLDRPLPEEWEDEAGFILEFYPVDLFGKSWYMDGTSGIFPRQANGPVYTEAGTTPDPKIIPDGEMKGIIPLPHHHARPVPMAAGRRLSIAPESDELRMLIETEYGELELLDGRIQHNNGWFIVRSKLRPGATKAAIEWTITPNVIEDWIYEPVLQYSQVGYHPDQKKVAVIETDSRDNFNETISLQRISPRGDHVTVLSGHPEHWGKFLRYNYYHFDFTEITEDGMYQLVMGDQRSEPFGISASVFKRNVWQPTLEYFLPVQMCHMRVKEKYRLWHDVCHLDDALMAPVDINHFDGYVQGPSTLTKFEPLEPVPGLNRGGWHDAGDDDLRVESQAYEIFILSAMWDEFRVTHDNTLIDQDLRLVEIHEPDGIPDILQQIEHGYLTVVGAYQSLGRLYRGIISPTLSQYVLAGDVSGQTDNLVYDPNLESGQRTATHSALPDDRLVFTEINPNREWLMISYIASGVNAMRGYNDRLAEDALRAATELWNAEREVTNRTLGNKIRAAIELFRVTGDDEYRNFILENSKFITENIRSVGWHTARVVHQIGDSGFTAAMEEAVREYYREVTERQTNTPYGVPYEPHIWGAGWGIQSFGVQQYFLHKAFPRQYGSDYLLNALNFVLGCHPGSNNVSYVSGVGAQSMTVAYGYNRMDYSHIPGGVVSGTALIRPDFPELKMFPYLWQQAEYVMGGGATNFMFLVLAADSLLDGE
jgi:endoglucanase